MYGVDNGGWMMGWNAGWPMLGWLWLILLWLIPILLLFALIKYLFGTSISPRQKDTPHKTALEILDETYAKGSISREDYIQRKDDLKA